MGFRNSHLFVLLALGILAVSLTASAQSRIDTKKLGEKILERAEEERREIAKLERMAEEARERAATSREEAAKSEARIAEIDRRLDEIKNEKKRLLRKIVEYLMNHEEIGTILREDPTRIRMVPAIEKLMKEVPWLDPVLDEILEDYSPSPTEQE